jgi:ribonuclease HI
MTDLQSRAPVVEGSRRKRERESDVVQERTPHAKQRGNRSTEELELLREVLVKFDGAQRQRKREEASIGVFIESWACDFNYRSKVDALTSNAAEIMAFNKALELIIEIVEEIGISQRYNIRGDSTHVIECIMSGRILQFEKHSRLPNSSLWMTTKALLQQLRDYGVDYNIGWVPRYLNREPDELCNCVLDGREPNHNIKSMPLLDANESFQSDLSAAIRFVTTHRRRTIRSLPLPLVPLWQSFLLHVLGHPRLNREDEPVITAWANGAVKRVIITAVVVVDG